MTSMPEAHTKATSVLVVDDHALFRESVARLLEAEPDFAVVGTCGTVDAALAAIRAAPVDVVLLDFDLGTRNGGEFVSAARREGFGGKILVVTAGVERDEAASLIRQGVAGIFMKHESAVKLTRGIRDISAGRVWLDQDVLEAALGPAGDPEESRRVTPFTGRERAVLALVFEGLANKEIADRIDVSESSVKGTLQQLFTKTGVRTRSQLVRIVLEQYRNEF
jgi:two-component system, NarL family, nitrate/nitrite response regulator NarL